MKKPIFIILTAVIVAVVFILQTACHLPKLIAAGAVGGAIGMAYALVFKS